MTTRGFKFGESVTSTSTGASADVIFTVPARHYAEVTFLIVENGSGAAQEITLETYDASNSAYFNIIEGFSVSNKTFTKIIEGGPLYLESGDQIVGSVNAGAIDVVVSGLLHYKGL